MAKAEILVPIILKHEGGFVNDKDDSGGATMKGVTLKTYREFYGMNKTVADLKAITNHEWTEIFKVGYWDPLKGDEINNQSIANLLVDFGYNSGTATAAKKIQSILGVTADGKIGPMTIAALNFSQQEITFSKLKQARIDFYEAIIRNKPSQEKFRKGWMNRVNSFYYEP